MDLDFEDLLNVLITPYGSTKGAENEYGEFKLTWDVTASFNAALQGNEGEEVVELGGKVIKATHTLYCPTSINLVEGSRVYDGNKTYKVLWVDDECMRGHHLKVLLRRLV